MRVVIAVLLVLIFCRVNAQNTKPDSAGILPDTNAQYITLDTLKVTSTPGAPVFRSTSAIVWKIHNTRAAINFDFKARTANVTEWLKMSPYCYAADTIALDAKTIVFDTVAQINGNQLKPMKFIYKNDRLLIYLNRSYYSTDTVLLYLKYTSKPYDIPTGGSDAITDDRGLYFVNNDNSIPNKPLQIWTQGETESNSHWLVTVDKPNTRFTTQIELTIPDTLISLSNGALIRQTKQPGGLRTDIWRTDLPIQAYAVMFAIGKYSIVQDKWRGKEVNYYVEPEFAKYARQMFRNTPEMIEYFSQCTGIAYPWNKYSQVVVHDYVSGAMENTSASLFGEFMNMNAREIADKSQENVVAHELFHQWFGDYVTAESWSNLTLNESFANYGEQLWKAYKYGNDAAEELAYTDLQGYLQSSAYNDPQLVRYYYDDREDMFDAISYNKGGAILRYIHSLAGDVAFRKAMNIYLTKNALHSAEAHSWRMALEEATGQDWSWFFNQWYFHAGHPVLKINYLYNDTLGTLKVVVAQDNADSPFVYKLALKAALVIDSKLEVTDWVISKRRDTFAFSYAGVLRPVFIPDFTHVLPGIIRDKKEPGQWLLQYQYTNDFVNKRNAVAAAGKQIADSCSQLLIERAIGDNSATIRRLAFAQIEDLQTMEYRKRWAEKTKISAVSDTVPSVRAQAFDVLGNWKDSTSITEMIKACFDSSYIVAASALLSLEKIYPDTVYRLALKLAETNPKSALESAVYMIIGKKGNDKDISCFELHAPHVFNTKKYALSSAITTYSGQVKSDSAFYRAVDLLVTMILNESMKNIKSNILEQLLYVGGGLHNKLKSDDKLTLACASVRLPYVVNKLNVLIKTEKDYERIEKLNAKIKEFSE